MVYDTLVYYNKADTSSFMPGLADQWNVSTDAKTYTFHIRTGATFSNGNPLTPEDVKYSFERGMVQDYSTGPQWLIFEPLFGVDSSRDADGNLMPLSQLTSAITIDGQNVIFHLAAPFPPFLQILCGSWGSIVNKAWCIQQGDWDGTQASYEKLNNPESYTWPLHEKMMGTGPFTLEAWNHASDISFLKRAGYWRGDAKFDRVDIRTVTEWTDRKLALEAGDADWVDVPVENYSEMDGVSGLTVFRDLPNIQVNAIFLTYDITPDSQFIGSGKLDGNGIPTDFFTDINVRKAFEYSFDWDAYINELLLGHGQQADSPIVEGLPFYNPDIPKYSHDAAKATEFFKAAWGGQVWDKGFKMVMAYNQGNTTRKTACDILAAGINAINPKFQVTSQAQQWSGYNSHWRAHELPAFVVGWLPDYMDPSNFIQPFMASTGTFSGPQGYGSPEIDALIAKGLSTSDPTIRKSVYDQLSLQYYNDAPGILLDQPSGNRYFRDWVQGFFFNPAETNNGGNPYYQIKSYTPVS